MSVQLAPSPKFQGIGFGGLPVQFGQLFTYIAGTTTPQATYTDSTQAQQNTNPVILDANASANVWTVFGLTYKFILKDALGNQVYSVDQIPGGFPFTQQQIGQLLYPQTAAEIAAGVVPTLYFYQPGNVLRYGADPSSIGDSTTAFQSAINGTGTSGGLVTIPQGVYLISGTTVNESVTLQGSGPTSAVIKPKTATGTTFDVTTTDVIFNGLAWNFGPGQTGGAYINFDVGSGNCTVENCFMLGWENGIIVNGSGEFTIRDTEFANGVPSTGTAINVIGTVVGIMTLDNILVTNPTGSSQQPFAGLFYNGGGNVNINCINSQFIQCLTGVSLNPGTGGVVADFQALNCYFDHCVNRGCLIQPSGTGAIVRTVFTSCWFGSAYGSGGIGLLCSSGSGTIDGVTLTGCNAVLNNAQGAYFAGAGTQNVQINGGFYAGNGQAGIVFDAAATTGASVTGAKSGPWGSIGGNATFGIQILSGTANNFTISGCDLRGNTTSAIGDSSTGTTGRLKVNNKGYNPIGIAVPTYPGTGATYTVGDTPETLFINDGTVGLVKINGTAVFQASPCTLGLNPGDQVVCTSSVNPTYVANRQ